MFFFNILNHANVSWSLSVLKCINKATVKRKKSWTAWDLNTIPRMTFGAFSNKNPAEAAARQFPANQIQGRGVWQKRVLGLGFHLSEVLELWEFTQLTGPPVSAPTFSLCNCGVPGDKAHDGCWRWHLIARHACPSRVPRHHPIGLPILGLSRPPCPDQHPPAGGGHLAFVQRRTISWIPEE